MSGCGHGIENIGDTDLEIIALILLDKTKNLGKIFLNDIFFIDQPY